MRRRRAALRFARPSLRKAWHGSVIGLGLMLALNAGWATAADATPPSDAGSLSTRQSVETIVLMRHGEKPMEGFGQLNCQGLNRALALPKMLAKRYGRPDLIIAPNPAVLKSDLGRSYAYVRPLATIEPTAIANGMPIDVSLGYEDRDALVDRLLAPELAGKTVFVAWEHRIAEQVAKALLQRLGGSVDQVPRWSSSDYDSLYVIRVSGPAGQADRVSFTHEHEQLNGQPAICP